ESKGAERIVTETGISRSRLIEMYRDRVKFLAELEKIARVRPEFREYGTVTKVVWAFQSCPHTLDLDSLVITPEGKVKVSPYLEAGVRTKDYRDGQRHEKLWGIRGG
ncbi:MAG: hypothetical protein NO515_07795, partial [Candidatus Methanomethylicia archaeon]|nr:hypothetical protein [Candidatus Methanomethylicia archaeon]